jgi:hypothetical protein
MSVKVALGQRGLNKMNTNIEKELELLKEENKKLKKELKKTKKKSQSSESSSSNWDFHWDGRGDYEESRRCFYGDFS